MDATTPVIEHASEISELASLLISRFGERAATYASHQALKARHSGETRRMEAWRQIADAAAQVWRTEPVEPVEEEHALS